MKMRACSIWGSHPLSRSIRLWCICCPCTRWYQRRRLGRSTWDTWNPCSICLKDREKGQPRTGIKCQQLYVQGVICVLSREQLPHVHFIKRQQSQHVRCLTVGPTFLPPSTTGISLLAVYWHGGQKHTPFKRFVNLELTHAHTSYLRTKHAL